jgi:hypothetical protein
MKSQVAMGAAQFWFVVHALEQKVLAAPLAWVSV